MEESGILEESESESKNVGTLRGSGKYYSQLPNFIQWVRTLEGEFIFPDET